MAAKLTLKITASNFELIRDRICEILALELHNQAIITPAEPSIYASIWKERNIAFDLTEMPAVNVSFSKGNNDQKYSKYDAMTYSYFIDIFTKSKSSSINKGDELSSTINQRILGIISRILSNPQYNTLDFSKPSIANVSISEMSMADSKNNEDAVSVSMSRLILDVTTTESNQLQTSTLLAQSYSKITVNQTNKGYQYILLQGD